MCGINVLNRWVNISSRPYFKSVFSISSPCRPYVLSCGSEFSSATSLNTTSSWERSAWSQLWAALKFLLMPYINGKPLGFCAQHRTWHMDVLWSIFQKLLVYRLADVKTSVSYSFSGWHSSAVFVVYPHWSSLRNIESADELMPKSFCFSLVCCPQLWG